MKSSLAETSLEIVESATGERPAQFSEPLKSFDFKDINKTAIAKNLQEDIRNHALVEIVANEEIISYPPGSKFPQIEAVKEFFERPLDAPEDLGVKKTAATGIYIAKELGLTKSLDGKTVDEIAAIADYGVTGAKVAYKVGTGEMDAVDAIDYMVDKATATVASFVKKTVAVVGEWVGRTAGMRIGSFWGPTGSRIGAKLGGELGRYGGEKIAATVEKGVRIAGNAVKKVAHKVWEGAKAAVNSIKEKFLSIF